jgi:YebC/PmpR family DNA-binding regulatory protein
MAGHSKWANIKRRKAAQDAKKGQAYAKACREMIKAAQLGGGDPDGNYRLRAAIDKAKAAGVGKDTIEQAIAKGTGKGSAENLEELTYEGYGPGGVAILIEAMTDNRNRTAGDIRSYFNKYQGNLGETGCVGWMFTEVAEFSIPASGQNEDALLELLLPEGLDDLSVQEDVFVATCSPDQINALSQALQSQGIPIESMHVTRVSQTTVEVTEPDLIKPLLKLLDAIEAHDDVQDVYANVSIPESALSSIAG